MSGKVVVTPRTGPLAAIIKQIIAARLYPGRITIPKHMFQETQSTVAVPKGQHAEVIARLSRGLDAIRADGTWQKINACWMRQ
jgi:polar amino acid transport system substrate-binding protein